MGDDDRIEYLTPGQVAVMLGVSPKTVTRWAVQGRLPCLVTLGGHRRFRSDDVEKARLRMHDASTAGGG